MNVHPRPATPYGAWAYGMDGSVSVSLSMLDQCSSGESQCCHTRVLCLCFTWPTTELHRCDVLLVGVAAIARRRAPANLPDCLEPQWIWYCPASGKPYFIELWWLDAHSPRTWIRVAAKRGAYTVCTTWHRVGRMKLIVPHDVAAGGGSSALTWQRRYPQLDSVCGTRMRSVPYVRLYGRAVVGILP